MLSPAQVAAETIKFCLFVCAVEPAPAADSFCSAYQQINRNPLDAAEIKRLSREPKVRINANDVLYLCRCRGWDNPICK